MGILFPVFEKDEITLLWLAGLKFSPLAASVETQALMFFDLIHIRNPFIVSSYFSTFIYFYFNSSFREVFFLCQQLFEELQNLHCLFFKFQHFLVPTRTS